MAKRGTAKNIAGRPPSGPGGSKSSEFPHQISTRAPSLTFHTLDAIAGATGKPYFQLLDRAIALFLEHEMSAADRKVIDLSVRQRIENCTKCGPLAAKR